jgi:hypothetical protein
MDDGQALFKSGCSSKSRHTCREYINCNIFFYSRIIFGAKEKLWDAVIEMRFLGQLQAAGVIKAGLDLEDLFHVFRGTINYRLVAPPTGDGKKEIIDRHAETITRLLLAG